MEHYKMLVNGKWIDSSTNENIHSMNPYNEEAWASIPQASERDIESAINSARNAHNQKWKNSSGLERATFMFKLADLLDDNAEYLGRLETNDNGKILKDSVNQMHFAARIYRFYAGYADKLYGETIPLDNDNLLDYTVREPLGVAVLITAWNSPMQLLANKLGPALAAGNCVVIKPSEFASVSTLEFGRLVEKAGFPPGVINIVTGDGKVGHYLTSSNQMDKISFTGGLQAARLIGANAAKNFVPMTLELGGKSPHIIFSDADLDKAVTAALAGIFASSGQTCVAGSRLLVEKSVYTQVCDMLLEKTKNIKLGDPLDETTQMGPVANESQYKRLKQVLENLETQGAKVLIGKNESVSKLKKGYFIAPTVVIDVSSDMEVARDEIFGPVLSVLPFENEQEAIQIANSTIYGLASGLWTSNLSRAHRVAKQLDAGTVWINTYRTSAAQAPFGGVKQSGYGRERGEHALSAYTRIKNIMIDLSVE